MEVYIKYLIEQFNQAKGVNYTIADLGLIDRQLMDWNQERRILSLVYIDFLKESGLDLMKEESIELDKGIEDTLPIITQERISSFINGNELIMYQEEPFIVTGSNIVRSQASGIYSTHNPYSNPNYTIKFLELCNYGYIISFGFFGSKLDEDIIKKLKILRNFAQLSTNDLEFCYAELGGNYFSALYSKQKVKVNVKTR